MTDMLSGLPCIPLSMLGEFLKSVVVDPNAFAGWLQDHDHDLESRIRREYEDCRERLLSTREVADMLQISPSTVANLVRAGQLCAIRVGTLSERKATLRFTRRAIQAFLETNELSSEKERDRLGELCALVMEPRKPGRPRGSTSKRTTEASAPRAGRDNGENNNAHPG